MQFRTDIDNDIRGVGQGVVSPIAKRWNLIEHRDGILIMQCHLRGDGGDQLRIVENRQRQGSGFEMSFLHAAAKRLLTSYPLSGSRPPEFDARE
jgi:hypothetical protein